MHDTGIDVKAIIDEVARRHHVRLAPDDPILATVTATEMVNRLFAVQLERLVEGVANQATHRLAAQIETGRQEIVRGMEDARAAAAKLINDAGAWSTEQLNHASDRAAGDIQRAVTNASSSLQGEIQTVSAARRTAVWAAGVALVVGALFVGGGIGFWLAGS